MPDISIDTGSAELDEDLRAFLTARDDGTLDTLASSVQEGTTDHEFDTLVPDELVRIIWNFRPSSKGFDGLRDDVKECARPVLDEVKSIVQGKKMSSVLKHPRLESRASELRQRMRLENSPYLLTEGLKAIENMQGVLTWRGCPPELEPNIRIGLAGKDRKLLLDSTLDWSGVLWLASALLRSLAEGMVEGRALADLEQVAKLDSKPFTEHLDDIEKQIQVVRDHICLYADMPEHGEKRASDIGDVGSQGVDESPS